MIINCDIKDCPNSVDVLDAWRGVVLSLFHFWEISRDGKRVTCPHHTLTAISHRDFEIKYLGGDTRAKQ